MRFCLPKLLWKTKPHPKLRGNFEKQNFDVRGKKGLYCSHNDYVPRVLRVTKNEGVVFFVFFSLDRGTVRSVSL